MIIPYEDKYREELCYMINRLYIEDPEGEPMSAEKIERTIRQYMEHPERLKIWMITDEANEVLGYAIIQLIWSNEWGGITANVDEMYIKDVARGKGVATEFMKSIPEIVSEANRITLEVTPSNDRAMKLYEQLGFEVAENSCMQKKI